MISVFDSDPTCFFPQLFKFEKFQTTEELKEYAGNSNLHPDTSAVHVSPSLLCLGPISIYLLLRNHLKVRHRHRDTRVFRFPCVESEVGWLGAEAGTGLEGLH